MNDRSEHYRAKCEAAKLERRKVPVHQYAGRLVPENSPPFALCGEKWTPTVKMCHNSRAVTCPRCAELKRERVRRFQEGAAQ